MPAPVGAEPTTEEPEQLIPHPQPGASFRASGDRQLVTEEQVLEDEVVATAERRGDDAEQEGDQFEHARRMTDRGASRRRAARRTADGETPARPSSARDRAAADGPDRHPDDLAVARAAPSPGALARA